MKPDAEWLISKTTDQKRDEKCGDKDLKDLAETTFGFGLRLHGFSVAAVATIAATGL